MSIASNVERIINAKADIKTAIERRGVSIDTNATIDTYSEAIDSCPYSVRGYFTPKKDTNVFSTGILPFKPRSIIMSNLDLYQAPINNAVVCYGQIEGTPGVFAYGNSAVAGSISVAVIFPNSTALDWKENSFTLTMPAAGFVFKAGYTYEYIVSGGFE